MSESDLPSVPPDSSEIVDLKHGHKAKVERTRPENTAEWLAKQLIEALESERVHRMERQSYEVNARSEAQKIQQFKEVIRELKRRKKNPPKKVSRMDPYNTYDLGMCEEELAQSIQRRQEFIQAIADHTEGEKTAQRKQKMIQKRLAEINKKK